MSTDTLDTRLFEEAILQFVEDKSNADQIDYGYVQCINALVTGHEEKEISADELAESLVIYKRVYEEMVDATV